MKTVSYKLKRCPLCGTKVQQNNIAPYFCGIECPNPKCEVICSFPTDLQLRQIVSRYNTRYNQSVKVMPVTTRFAIWVTVASLVIFGISSIYGFIVHDIHTMLTSLKF